MTKMEGINVLLFSIRSLVQKSPFHMQLHFDENGIIDDGWQQNKSLIVGMVPISLLNDPAILNIYRDLRVLAKHNPHANIWIA